MPGTERRRRRVRPSAGSEVESAAGSAVVSADRSAVGSEATRQSSAGPEAPRPSPADREAPRPPAADPQQQRDAQRSGSARQPRRGRLAGAARPSPHDLAGRGATFALTSAVQDPEESGTDSADAARPGTEPATGTGRGARSTAPGRTDAAERRESTDGDREDDVSAERGLRGLVGGGSSQVGVIAALRARDAARPTEADLAAVEAELTIVRRGWIPREDLPRPGRAGRS